MVDDATPALLPPALPDYLYFPTEAEALAAEAEIAAAMGCEIVGTNAMTGQPDLSACKTSRWAIPVQAEGGQWAIPAPPKQYGLESVEV